MSVVLVWLAALGGALVGVVACVALLRIVVAWVRKELSR